MFEERAESSKPAARQASTANTGCTTCSKRHRTWPPKLDHPPVEVFLWDPPTFELGLDAVEVAPGERARIYSPSRTVVDLMRMRHKLGESVAHVAMRRYLSRNDARIADLMTYAKALDVLGPVRAVVDVLSAS